MPLGILLGVPELATGVELVASGFGRERMGEQAAFERLAGRDQMDDVVEVGAGLLGVPATIGTQFLKVKEGVIAVERVAVVAARTAVAIGEEDGFDAGDEELEVEPAGFGGPRGGAGEEEGG